MITTKYILASISQIMDKAGVTVVLDNNALITAYNTNSYKKY